MTDPKITIQVDSDRRKVERPTHHISLTSPKGLKIGLVLEDVTRLPQPSWVGGDVNEIATGTEGKYGEFGPGLSQKTWQSWEGGRGVERLEDQPDGFYDSKSAWTMTPEVLMAAPQWQYVEGINEKTEHTTLGAYQRVPRQVFWHALIGDKKAIEVPIAGGGSGWTVKKAEILVRRVGTPSGSLTLAIASDSGGDPSSTLSSTTIAITDVDDWETRVYQVDFNQALSASTDYHFGVLGVGSDPDNCWMVGISPADASSDHQYAEDFPSGSWATLGKNLYCRLLSADTGEILIPFVYQNCLYAYSYDLDNPATSSRLYIIGDRGKATSGSTTTLNDTGKSWPGSSDDKYFVSEDAVLYGFSGAGKDQATLITDYTATGLTVETVEEAFDSTTHYIITRSDYYEDISPSSGDQIDARIEHVLWVKDYVLFSFGSAAGDQVILKMKYDTSTGSHVFSDDGGGEKADMLATFQSSVDGPQLLQVDNTNNQVGFMDLPAYGTNLAFTNDKTLGSRTGQIVGITDHENRVYAFKSDGSVFYMQADVVRWNKLSTGTEKFPDRYTGKGATTWNSQLYWPYGGFSLNRKLGDTIDDIGPWQGSGLLPGRQGNIVDMISVGRWLIAAISNTSTYGLNNLSSIMVYDSGGWHEIFRGFMPGVEIRNLAWRAVPGFAGQLWWNYGEDLMYMNFPERTHNPEGDFRYQPNHEFVVVTPFFDFGAERLLKSFARLDIFNRQLNMPTVGDYSTIERWATSYTGNETAIHVDMQTDEVIGATGADNWVYLGVIRDRFLGGLDLHAIAKRIRFRFRCLNAGTQLWIKAAVLQAFTRKPNKLQWTIIASVSDDQRTLVGQDDMNVIEIFEILRRMSEEELTVTMRSVDPLMDNREVIVRAPQLVPKNYDHPSGRWEGRLIVNVREK